MNNKAFGERRHPKHPQLVRGLFLQVFWPPGARKQSDCSEYVIYNCLYFNQYQRLSKTAHLFACPLIHKDIFESLASFRSTCLNVITKSLRLMTMIVLTNIHTHIVTHLENKGFHNINVIPFNRHNIISSINIDQKPSRKYLTTNIYLFLNGKTHMIRK